MSTVPQYPRQVPNGLNIEPISDQLYRILSRKIVTGAYEPGQRLDPHAIAIEHGVSRTPVRDALARLANDLLIETRPRAGTFVAIPTLDDVTHVCELRKGIEWVATGIATTTMPVEHMKALREEILEADAAAREGDFEPFFQSDERLHREIVAATGNRRLVQVRASVEPYVYWLRVLGATGTQRVLGSSRRHLQIVEAMLSGDSEEAARQAALHLDEVCEWTIADLEGSRINQS